MNRVAAGARRPKSSPWWSDVSRGSFHANQFPGRLGNFCNPVVTWPGGLQAPESALSTTSTRTFKELLGKHCSTGGAPDHERPGRPRPTAPRASALPASLEPARVTRPLPDDLRLLLGEVDDRGGLGAAVARVEHRFDLVVEAFLDVPALGERFLLVGQ